MCFIFKTPRITLFTRYRLRNLWESKSSNSSSFTIPVKLCRTEKQKSSRYQRELLFNYILFNGLTTLSSPSTLRARHNFNKSPSSPDGNPFLSNHSKYSSGKSISVRPAYFPNGICIRANLIRFSFSSTIRPFYASSMFCRVSPKRSTQ